MVEVVTSPSPVRQTTGFFEGMVSFLHNNWGWLLFAMILCIVGIVLYYVVKKWEDERKERDEPGYQLYKSTIRTCKLQTDKKRIRKRWSWVNLLWLGIPIIMKEHSDKIVDMYNNLVGYYRGMYKGMDNSLNILMYKHKSFIFFEDLFILKIPLILKFKSISDNPGEDKKSKKLNIEQLESNAKDYVINMNEYLYNMKNGDIKLLNCSGVERLGLYYYCPVFELGKSLGVLDYRKVMEGVIVDKTYQVMLQRILNVGSRQMEKGMMFSPHLQYAQKAPEKTKAEERFERGEVG